MARASSFVLPLVSSLVLVACGSSDDRKTFDGSTPTDGGPSSSGTTSGSTDGGASDGAPGAATGDGSVGSACTQKSDCDAKLSLDCFTVVPAVPAVGFPGKTYPGGMCSRRCGTPNPDSPSPEDQNLSTDCGTGAVCVSSSSSGGGTSVQMQACLKSCNAESDCRTLEGYRCVQGLFGVNTCQAP